MRLEARLALYLHKAMCFTACAVSRSSAGEHQSPVNKQHYVLLIILNKNVDTNMTCSHPDDLWRTLWQVNCLLFSVSVLHTFGGSTGPANYRWHDRETCHSDIHDKWRRDDAAKHQQMNLKNAHMHARNSPQHRAAVLTSKLCRENLFVAANEGTDLRTSWLIIYPAGFMALINFPPLSLYLPFKVWSQPASGADNAGVSAASQPPL